MADRKPFTTDGCSGGMSWFWRKIFSKPPPWEDLCIDHDHTYWAGGTKAERLEADRELAAGVTLRGYPEIAVIMFRAIRVGGHPWMPFSWRWDYGNPGRSCYRVN